jgi:NAD-reducing hydrogenase small subunit
MSLLDMDERIVEIAGLVDIRSTPITDLKEPDATGVDVGILEGGVNNTANEEVAHRMRKRCNILVALGDCAVFGVPAMRNFFTIEELRRPMSKLRALMSGQDPQRSWSWAFHRVGALHEVVGGCFRAGLSPGCGCDLLCFERTRPRPDSGVEGRETALALTGAKVWEHKKSLSSQ